MSSDQPRAIGSTTRHRRAAMLTAHTSTVVHPWYRQFYLRRGEAEWASDRVTDEGYDVRIEAIDGFVYVGTSMYGHPTEVRVEAHDTPPAAPDDADHEVEVSLLGNGPLAILSWGDVDPVATIELPDGPVRLRASWFGLAAAVAHPDNDLGGEDPSPERLLFQAWPAVPAAPRVTRRWGAA
jgi:hypothetical protein